MIKLFILWLLCCNVQKKTIKKYENYNC
jgi:hypothetical protein